MQESGTSVSLGCSDMFSLAEKLVLVLRQQGSLAYGFPAQVSLVVCFKYSV